MADNGVAMSTQSSVTAVLSQQQSSSSSSHPDSGGGLLSVGEQRFRKNARLVENALTVTAMSRRRRQLRRSQSSTALGRTLSVPRGRRGVGRDDIDDDDDDAEPAVDQTLVYKTLAALFRCMTAVGVCFVRRPEPPLFTRFRRDHVTVKTGICGRRPTVNLALMLSFVVSVLLTANFARSLSLLQVGTAADQGQF